MMKRFLGQNYWRCIHDMTPASGETNWKLQDPEDFQIKLKEIEGAASPELAVPIPKV